MDEIIDIKGLSKKHFNKKILDNIHLTVKKNRMTGIFGPNSSGKSTLLKVMAGITKFNSGNACIDGKRVGKETKGQTAYLPDVHCFENWMCVRDCMLLYSMAFKDFDSRKAGSLLDSYGITAKDVISGLSSGKREILSVVLTLSRKASLYLLDEPLASVDPLAREKIIEMLQDNFNEDCAIVIATHLIKDVGKIFDDAVFMNNGRILISAEVEELKMRTGKSLEDIYKEILGNVCID